MTQETRDIIYNKKAELNKKDIDYINKLIIKDDNNFLIKETFIVTPLAFFSLPLIFGLLGLIILNPAILCVMLVTGFVVGGLLASAMSVRNKSLRELGLTRKDWKELKKSGRLKELKQVVKEYNQSKKSVLDVYEKRELDVKDKLAQNEEERKNLLIDLEDIQQSKSFINDGEYIRYDQKYVAEMLKSEENLLLRCLERNKQMQQIIDEETDEDVINEIGYSIKNRDYLTEALEACKQFNQEFDGETIDN